MGYLKSNALSWTPTLVPGAGSSTYNTQTGRYLFIGDIVLFSVVLGINTSTASSPAIIQTPVQTAPWIANVFTLGEVYLSGGWPWTGTTITDASSVVSSLIPAGNLYTTLQKQGGATPSLGVTNAAFSFRITTIGLLDH